MARFSALLLLLAATWTGCAGDNAMTSSGSPGAPQPALRCTTPIVGEDLSLTFAQLLGDDRCPQGVECIRAGEADVVIRVADSQHPPADLTLSTVDIPASHGSYHGFDVQLVQVTPYPEAGHAPTPEADTCVQLIVSRQR